ncbi:soluble pyridine nucleotide transhydrogenase [Anaerobiospirillum thomasii]|uniref:NAD(P)/FAD-dependent oxidoreductase n=1 Tax=Anaerobiospirillum thomasii TaxID=179995 RepID=UPI000DA07FFA|nr:FAD-dependent oxidoreductase [Anaerobiospirillum thomasii]SPT68444.1 soluble pyridine nucleotide transhydrogenase [Anaerobiospirillum thomasii]
MQNYDVIIIGSGPSGIGVAKALEDNNIKNYVILEREDHIGGIPFHCHHITFGLISKYRPMTGDAYINAIKRAIPDARFRLNTTAVKIEEKGVVLIHSRQGLERISAKRIVVCTGVRERSRAQHLVSGMRPLGVFTTSALQQFAYINKSLPFTRPVIVGSEHVAFSALMTLKDYGIKPVAMIERKESIQTFGILKYFGLALGTSVRTGTVLHSINGVGRVESVDLKDASGAISTIECDSVIFSGSFVSENALIRDSHIKVTGPDTGPFVSKDFVTSDPYVYAGGNLLHPADMGDRCYLEGIRLGQCLVDDLSKRVEPLACEYIPVIASDSIYHVQPSFVQKHQKQCLEHLRYKVKDDSSVITVEQSGKTIKSQSKNCYSHRFYTVDVDGIKDDEAIYITAK